MTNDGLIRVGVVGCGYWGPKLARNFTRQRGAEVTVVCDSVEERAMAIAEEYRVERHAIGFQSVTRADDVDLVVVATPSRTHYAIAKDAIAAGKHVLITKPITTCVEHAEELVALAERQGVVVAVDHTFLYTGAVSRIRELVASGELGEIYYVDSVRINLGLFQADVNVVWDLAPHDLSIIDYILGGVLPAEVSAVGASHAGSRTENIAYVTMRYGPHLLSHVHVNWLAPAKVRRTIVGGSKRMLVYDDMEPSEKIKIYDAGVSITPSLSEDELHSQVVLYRAGDMLAPKVDTREALAVEAEHIIDCIRVGAAPRADGHAGLRVVRILEAAQASIDAGGVPLAIERERAPAAHRT